MTLFLNGTSVLAVNQTIAAALSGCECISGSSAASNGIIALMANETNVPEMRWRARSFSKNLNTSNGFSRNKTNQEDKWRPMTVKAGGTWTFTNSSKPDLKIEEVQIIAY